MRYILTTIALVCSASAFAADSLSDSNLVKRSLTLKDNEVLLGAALVYGKNEVENEFDAFAAVRYGLTDNLSIGLAGVDYRFVERDEDDTGLEMAFNVGLKGMYESQLNGDSLGYGASVYGKYVLTNETAINFGASYIFWNEDQLANKKEWQYHLGMTQNITSDIAVFADFTYRDLNGFAQNSAIDTGIGVNYALNKNWDVGMRAGYTDFNGIKNQYDADNVMEKSLGAYLTYRF